MYLQCVNCPKLGVSCDGPRFFAMSPQELISWSKERKKHLRYTNAKLGELANVPQGTIDSLFANTHADFKFGTIRTVLQALVGADWSGVPCQSQTDESAKEAQALRDRIKQLEDCMQWRDEKIRQFADENRFLKERIADDSAHHQASQDFLREQIRFRNKVIAIIGTALGVSLVSIIGLLLV